MKTGPDISTIYRIARYYYAEEQSQEEIAAREGFSRSQISRLLERARALGLVKITLVPPADLRGEKLAKDLAAALSLRSIVVVPARKDAGEEEIALAIATRAADILPGLLSGFGSVGIGWGRTVYKTAELLARGAGKGEGPRFIPLIGISGDDNPNLQINAIIDRFSAAFRTKGFFVNFLSVREKNTPVSDIDRQRLTTLKKRWEEVEAAVVGLGPPSFDSSRFIDEWPGSYKTRLKNSAACGDILAQFFDRKGLVVRPECGYELLAFEIGRLRNLKRSVCLAGGSDKERGIVAAARSGYISDLVTDENTARAALALTEREAPAPRKPKAEPETRVGAGHKGGASRGGADKT